MAAKDITINDAVTDVVIREDSFTPEGESRPIHFVKLVVLAKVGGKDFEFPFKLTKDQKQIVSLLDTDSDLAGL